MFQSCGQLLFAEMQCHLAIAPLWADFDRAYRILSSASGVFFGAVRRNFMSPSPVALPARFLKKSAAVSTTPTFSATATAIHWFKDTPSSFASRWAAFLMDRGSFKGYVALLMVSPSSKVRPDAAQKF